LADELRGLDDYTARLAAVRPDDLPLIEALRAGLLAWAERLPEAETAVPLHRDFYYSQVLFAGLRLHLIDFDLMALGDPAVDVANFTAHLAYLGLEQFNDLARFDQDIADFLAVYQALSPLTPRFRSGWPFIRRPRSSAC
jgi:aminoglycoside phosphotransferase (APT) family kinase protein